MESDIVFAHELVEFDLFLILPPFLPLRSIASSNGDVTNWRVEPNVEDLILVFFKGHCSSPLKVTRDASSNETTLEHSVRE